MPHWGAGSTFDWDGNGGAKPPSDCRRKSSACTPIPSCAAPCSASESMSTTSSPDVLRPGRRRPHRVVILCAHGLLHRHTCATLLRAGVNVVGIVECDRPGVRAKAHFLRRWLARHGVLRTTGQVMGRVYDRLKNRRRDGELLANLVDDESNRRAIASHGAPTLHTDSYSRPDTIAALRGFDPDIFVVHSKYIVGPSVLRLPAVATIGGHPGITPFYRGAYSPFWALLH